MNDLMKPSELSQFLLQHSINNLNPGIIKSDPREDDSVFGGIWVQPEEEAKKNTLSLTGTEIWGPKPQLPNEKVVSSASSSAKGTSSDATPEIVPDKRDKFLFGNMMPNPGFSNNFPAYSHFTNNINSFGLTSPSADIPLNQNLSNNVQRKSDSSLSDDKFKSLGSVWNDGNKPAGAVDQDVLENLAQAIGDWNQKSALASNVANLSMLQKTTDVSSLEKFPTFCPSFGLHKELEKNAPCYTGSLPAPWSGPLKRSLACGANDNWMKLKNNPDFMANPMSGSNLNKTNQNPQCFSPWDQTAKSLFPGVDNAWNVDSLESHANNFQALANQQGKMLTNLNNSAAAMKDLSHPIKFDPSVPPPPLPGQLSCLLMSNPDLQLLAASTSLPPDQLLSLLKSSSSAAAKPYPMNLMKSNLASTLKPMPSLLGSDLPSSPVFGNQCSINSNYPWASTQRISDIQLAVLYRKLARQLFPGHQVPQTRSKMLQQLISLGFKREDAGKALMNNDLDFELALGELVFKTAVAKGLVEDPFKPARGGLAGINFPRQYPDPNKGGQSMNKQGETFQNYIASLELIIRKQELLSHSNPLYSSCARAKPQIDYAIQALLNSQPNPPPSTYLPNLSFSSSSNNNNSSCFRSSLFESSSTPSPPFLLSQQGPISNLNPQSPEWVPGGNLAEGGGSSLSPPETRTVGDGSLEVSAILSNLKLNSSTGRVDDVMTAPIATNSQLWTSKKTGALAAGKATFSIPNPSSALSSMSIKEFIPGVPWKEVGTSCPGRSEQGGRTQRGFGNYFGTADDAVLGDDRRGRDAGGVGSSGIWTAGSDGNAADEGGAWMVGKKRNDFYGREYSSLDLLRDELDGSEDEAGQMNGRSSLFQSNWIVVKNIPETVSEEEMTDILIGYGPIKSMTFMKDTHGVLVCYASKSDAIGAKKGLAYSNGGRVFFEGTERNNLSVEFVPDWTASLGGGVKISGYDEPFYDGDEAVLGDVDSSPTLPDVGYTTPGGLWIPSKVLQDLEVCSAAEEEEVNDDDNDDSSEIEEEELSCEDAFEHELQK